MVSVGDPTLNSILKGGIPRNRAVLVVGSPGTGKSTLAMQFLQEGVRQGEECLYISTEQTPAELRDNFAPYKFDLTHENLTITSIHARPGHTLDDEEEQLIIETLEGEQLVGEGYSAPFSARYINQLLGQNAPADRVVVDSVSGLRAISHDDDVFRRAILDFIRLLSDEFEATSIFVAEERYTTNQKPIVNLLQYTTHGALRLWRERKGNEYRRFINVMKMRGVAHDDRNYEIAFEDSGVAVVPSRRALSAEAMPQDRLSTGLTTFDTLLGGGYSKGDSVLLEHDGKANVNTLLFTLIANMLEAELDLVLLPRANTSPQQIEGIVADTDLDFSDGRELLDADRLFILDVLGAWENHENVYDFRDENTTLENQLRAIRETSAGEGLFLVMNTEAKVHVLGKGKGRRIRYWLQSTFLESDDVLLDVHNPKMMSSQMAEFYTDAASQAISTWLDENGLQYLHLKKGITGNVGGLRLVEYTDEYPFVRLR